MPALNTLVLAKMKTWSPWPSKLLQIGEKRAYVYFFGTENHGYVDNGEIVSFVDSQILISKLASMKIPDYKRAVREAEISVHVPMHLSILNQ